MTDKNMNEDKGLHKDLDLLITAVRQVVRGHNEGKLDSERRIRNLSKMEGRVEPQYKAIMNGSNEGITSILVLLGCFALLSGRNLTFHSP